jgi:hypothetical protein
MLLFFHTFKSNAFISLERLPVVMFVADNLPGNPLGKGIAGSLFLVISVQVLAFGTKRYYFNLISFHGLLTCSFLTLTVYVFLILMQQRFLLSLSIPHNRLLIKQKMGVRKCSSIRVTLDIYYGHLMEPVNRGEAVTLRATLFSSKDQEDGSTMVAEEDRP